MLGELIQVLVESGNEAADEVLLEALRLGSEPEKALALNALLRRHTDRGLAGVIAGYHLLPQSLQLNILQNIRTFHAALRECGRGSDRQAAVNAMKLIALGRQGKLTYLLSDGLHSGDEAVAQAAVEAMVALARWVAIETRHLQRPERFGGPAPRDAESRAIHQQLVEERPDIEHAVARALDVHRGRHGQELLRAALLLMDSPASKTFAILTVPKHGGQNLMVRRLQQAPDSEHVDAFLLGGGHGGLRAQFGIAFSHIESPPVLDTLLRRTHWLKDQQLQLCMHQVVRGAWWDEGTFERDLARRDNEDASRVGEWIGVSGIHDVVQDERLVQLWRHLKDHFPGRLRLMRVAMTRPAGMSTALLREMLQDGDERISRMAVRELVRRKPADYENILLQAMPNVPDSAKRIISRAVGRAGFDHYWDRFERMNKATRKAAGRAMLKLMPDGVQRLERRLRGGSVEQRIKAVSMTQELGVGDAMAPVLMQLCQDPHPKLRSKAVMLLAELKTVTPDVVLEKVLNDTDSRVRANAIEVLEARRPKEFLPLLMERARSTHNRERANAIKALHRMRVGKATEQLMMMMRDDRPEHRVSALWALKQIGWWAALQEVGRLAKADTDLRVRRYAMVVLRSVAEMVEERRRKTA